MSAFSRLVEKFINQPGDITVGDIVRLLEGLGFTERKNPGSHRVFHKKGNPVFPIPTVHGRYVKKRYILQLIKLLDLEGYSEEYKGE